MRSCSAFRAPTAQLISPVWALPAARPCNACRPRTTTWCESAMSINSARPLASSAATYCSASFRLAAPASLAFRVSCDSTRMIEFSLELPVVTTAWMCRAAGKLGGADPRQYNSRFDAIEISNQQLFPGAFLAYDDLRQWISALDKAGELNRVRAEVDPVLEITEITDRVSKGLHTPSRSAGNLLPGRALLFENIKRHPGARVLINQFGSARRMCMALGVDSLDEIAERIRGFMDVKSPQGFLDKVKMLPMLADMGKFFPKTVSTGPCKEVIKRDNFSLLDFPILQCWPKDAGRFITLPCVITRDPKTGKRNVGMYRMQIYDERTTGMHWQRQKVGAEHYREALRAAAAGNP